MFGLIWGGSGCVALADAPSAEGAFSGDVSVLKQEKGRYVMQVTVENSGEDFTGTVQVIFGTGYDNCAYNTELTLPAQGKKQFTITVPERAADTVYGICQLNFLDEEENVIQSIPLRDVFKGILSGITVGILSDDYSGLTFMDAGGTPLRIAGSNYPVKLIELNNDNLTGYLNGLYFLVIDQFNVSALSEENIQAIQDWVRDGGWLIVGTGAYAEQTLSGFDEDFLNVEVTGVSEPGEENIAAVNGNKYGYYFDYIHNAEIDFSQMAVADLNFDKIQAYIESTENPAVNCLVGEGAVFIFYFSLGEKELLKMDSQMVNSIYQELMSNSGRYQSFSATLDMEYVGQRALAFMENINAEVDFSWLRVLMVIYVVAVGPVLYLILRKCKKREWYWVGAPALGILFIVGVYFFGTGVRVNETRVCSVTVQQVDGDQADTYFLAYHSGVKPWEVRLDDSYVTAGPGFQGHTYYGSSTAVIDDYHYLVRNGSEGLTVGLKPRENFENAFLYAGKRSEGKGTITGTELADLGTGKASGSVTNGTAYDMAYMAVWDDFAIIVISDVKAGETVDLHQALKDGRCVYQENMMYLEGLLHDMVGIYGTPGNYDQDDMAALLIGLGIAEGKKPRMESATLVGVVKDYDRSVADKCSEIAYGCLYSYAETGTAGDDGQTDMGGGQDASY